MNLLITGAAGFIGSAIYKEAALHGGNWGISGLTGVDWDDCLCRKIEHAVGIEGFSQDTKLICADFSSDHILKSVENKKYDHLIIKEKPKINYDTALLDNGVEPNIETNIKAEVEPSKITIIKQTKNIFDIDFTDY